MAVETSAGLLSGGDEAGDVEALGVSAGVGLPPPQAVTCRHSRATVPIRPSGLLSMAEVSNRAGGDPRFAVR